jgi:hypothetical protein
MAAERRCAATLDRTHDLHLAKAHMTGVASTPRRPVVAENIRDLQRWTGHGRYAVGWSFLLFSLAFLGFLRGCDDWLGRTEQRGFTHEQKR